jgi:hypothetical protein
MQKGGNEHTFVKNNRKPAFGKAKAELKALPAPAYDPASGEKALALVKPLLLALPADEIETPRLDLELAALTALNVARLVHEPSLLERFRAMPAAEIDREAVDRLEPFAWAAWHAHRAHQIAARSSSAAVVPVALAEAATELERRMQRCVEYHLADHPEAAAKVAFLRAGTGYRDLAGDLMGYAELYRDYVDELRHDRKQYRVGDADEAVRLATQLFETLAFAQGGVGQALSVRDRAWTLLLRCYDEVAATGRWLLRHEPKVDAYFPSLHSAGRPGIGRSKASKTPNPTPTEEPGPFSDLDVGACAAREHAGRRHPLAVDGPRPPRDVATNRPATIDRPRTTPLASNSLAEGFSKARPTPSSSVDVGFVVILFDLGLSKGRPQGPS